MNLDAIATAPALAGLRARPQWVLWRLVPDPGRPDKAKKVPFNARTWLAASSTDPTTWAPFDVALASARTGPGWGLGYVFAADHAFVDLDGALQPDNTWSPLAVRVCEMLRGAAVEVSQSGTGLHLICRGTLPPHSNKNIAQRAELYTTGRFVALTGKHLTGDCSMDATAGLAQLVAQLFPPRPAADVALPDSGPCAEWRGPADDDELLRRAMQSRSAASVFGDGNRASFADLWHADAAVLARAYPPDASSSDPYDRSSADAALASHLAWWTGRDVARIERLMRRSKLARPKWDDRADYLERTITNACRMQRDVLQDRVPDFKTEPGPTVSGETPAMRAVNGSTILGASEARELLAGCVYVRNLHRVACPGGLLLKPEAFKVQYGGHTFVMDPQNGRTSRDPFEAFTQSQLLKPPIADGTCFRPLLAPGVIVDEDGQRLVNTWHPPNVRRVAGDMSPFLRHLEKLLPEESDRLALLHYLANMVQNKGHKFQFAPLIVGAQGNGKTFFSRCITHALGKRYVFAPKPQHLGKQFNAWMAEKLAYLVEDVFVNDASLLETMKPLITSERIEIEGKGVDQVTAEVCGNFIFNSNRRDAIQKTGDDRRYMVLWCAQQSPEDRLRDGMGDTYFSDLYGWACDRDGYAIVAEFLHTLPLPADRGLSWVMGRAPVTSSTAAAIEATRGPFEVEVLDAIEQGAPGFRGGWVSSIMLRQRIDARRRRDDPPRSEWASLLRGLGYVPHPALKDGQVHNPVLPDGGKPRLYVRVGSEAETILRPADVAAAYARAQVG